MKEISIIRTGIANTASVVAACKRLSLVPRFTEDPQKVRSSPYVVLPGVGAFGPGMEFLSRTGIDSALKDRLGEDRPTLAICLGFQLLFAESAETPGVRGLGVFPQSIGRFTDTVKAPQLGWNAIESTPGCRSLERGFAYFANSYRLTNPPEGVAHATALHGESFVAGIERGRLLACQFHPELSGELGMRILKNWAALETEGERSC